MQIRKHHTRSARIIEFLLLIALPVICHFLIPVKILLSGPVRLLGIVLMIIGVYVSTKAAQMFRKAGADFKLQGQTPSLVITGVFQYTRNPMYIGFISWLTGIAVLLGSLTPFLFPVLIFLMLNFIFIPMEEVRMEKLFGNKYQTYKMKVRRWL